METNMAKYTDGYKVGIFYYYYSSYPDV